MSERLIEIRERSTTPITPEDYRALENEPKFWGLVDAGIVTLERGRLSHYTISAGPYVGQAAIGGLLIRISEKIAGALPALLMFPQEVDARVFESQSFLDRSNLVLRILIDKFLYHLDQYLRAGRLKIYDKVLGVSSLPRGKVLVAKTMRRWAAGRRDQVIYSYDHLTPDVLLNRLIGFALHLIDPMVRGDGKDADRRKRVRVAALLFEDSNWQSLLFMPRPVIDRLYVAASYNTSSFSGLASPARMFALHFGLATSASENRIGYSWFVNLETLFEDCVRESMSLVAIERGLEVTDWRRDRRFVFPTAQKYRAEPDLVAWRGGKPSAVLDAKYKDNDDHPANPDIYQMIAHADAWKVDRTALVYPGTSTNSRSLGVSAGGAALHSLTMDVLHPLASAARLLDSLIETEAVQQHEALGLREAGVPMPAE